MEKVSIDDVEPSAVGQDVDQRGLSDPLDTTDLAINHYQLEPGERFSGGLHTHMDQEEVFAVVAGEATFETLDGEVTVEAGEVVRFAPGEYQSGKNDGDEEVVAFAMGAPRESEDVRVPMECRECGHENMQAVPADDGDGFDFVCPDCGTDVEG